MPDVPDPHRSAASAMDAAIALIALLLIVQMWVLTAALEDLLAGSRAAALPAALLSAALFAFCFLLYRFLGSIDRRIRRP